jgi:Spy/CpxP family protein refolding chaperone
MLRIRSTGTAALSLTLLAAFALAASAGAWPGAGPGHGAGPHGRFLERQLERLDLPAETRSAVQAVLDESKAARQELHQQIRAAHESMRALLEKDPVDEAAVMAQADAIGALMTQSRKQELGTLIRVRSLLTPEQRAELDAQMQARRERGWHGKRGGPGGPEGCEHGKPMPHEDRAATPAEPQS